MRLINSMVFYFKSVADTLHLYKISIRHFMHKLSLENPIPSLTAGICRNQHLEGLFLEYLRIGASIDHLKGVQLSPKHIRSLHILRQIALDAFLVEANRRYPIQELNGQIPELIHSVSHLLTKRFRLEEYFS
ncbi:MAG: hypothetical protein IH596_01085 [Bacteroidales bacterium]|nr:hypothetical protein [Bacteroidales bacterium]